MTKARLLLTAIDRVAACAPQRSYRHLGARAMWLLPRPREAGASFKEVRYRFVVDLTAGRQG